MCFTSASLTVSEEGSVVAFEYGLDKMVATFVEFLLCARVEDVIESEYFFFVVFAFDVDGSGVTLIGGGITYRIYSIYASR